MGTVLNLEEASLSRLRAQLGAATEERDNLLAFARGHSGAVASIHRAVLRLFDGVQHGLFTTVTREWPAILGVDFASIVLIGPDAAQLVTARGACPLDRILASSLAGSSPLVMRSVARGHAFFGSDSEVIRAEALIRFDCREPGVTGILLLGQRESLPVDSRGGEELLQFLASSLGAMIGRWSSPTES